MPALRDAALAGGGLVVTAWTLFALHQAHVARVGVLYLVVSTFVFLGVGSAAILLADVWDGGLTWLGLRYITGFALAAFLLTVLTVVGLAGAAFWIVVAVAVAGWCCAVWTALKDRSRRPSVSLLCAEFFVGSLVLRVAFEGTGYWQTRGARSVFTQYPDLLYHLAVVKDGLYRGLPLRGYVLESGVPRIAYHPGFDTMTTLFIKGLRLPVDEAFFRLLLPVSVFALIVAVAVFAVTWSRSRVAAPVALALLAIALALSTHRVPLPVLDIIGRSQVSYFIYNPPSAVGAVGALACLALVALSDQETGRKGLVLAGVIAGTILLTKVQTAIIVAPAFTLALLYEAWPCRRLRWRPAALAVGSCAVAGLVAYPATLGYGGPPALVPGALGGHLMSLVADPDKIHIYPWLVRALADPLARLGTAGDMLFVVVFVLVAICGWPLLVLGAAEWRARQVRERPFGHSPLATHMAVALAALGIVVGLVAAQRNVGSTSSWNIGMHTIHNFWWLCLCAAAVALTPLLRRLAATFGIRFRVLSRAVVLIAIVALVVAALPGVTDLRQVRTGILPTHLRLLLEEWGGRVPADAVVVQHYDNLKYPWGASIGGRRAVLERASLTRNFYPARTALLWRAIADLYATTDPQRARDLVRRIGADYAVVRAGDERATGLRAIGAEVMRRGAWVLLRLNPG